LLAIRCPSFGLNGVFKLVACVVHSVVTLGQVDSLVVDGRGVVGAVVVVSPVVVDVLLAVVLVVIAVDVVDVVTPTVCEMLVIIGLGPSPQEFLKSSVLISQTMAPPSPFSRM